MHQHCNQKLKANKQAITEIGVAFASTNEDIAGIVKKSMRPEKKGKSLLLSFLIEIRATEEEAHPSRMPHMPRTRAQLARSIVPIRRGNSNISRLYPLGDRRCLLTMLNY